MSEDAHDTSKYDDNHPGWDRLRKALNTPPDSILNAYRFGLEATHGVVLPPKSGGLTPEQNRQVDRLIGLEDEQ